MNQPIAIWAESSEVVAASELEFLRQQKREALLQLVEHRSELEHLRHLRREVRRTAAMVKTDTGPERLRHMIKAMGRKAQSGSVK